MPRRSSVSRLRYTEPRSDAGVRPSRPLAICSAVTGLSAANSAASTSRRADDARRPLSRTVAMAAASVAGAGAGAENDETLIDAPSEGQNPRRLTSQLGRRRIIRVLRGRLLP